MERISTEKLPPIFKMSVLWNILPYYGHLHRWRRLLEKINTETKEIWDQNREQLMHIGRDFKREIELDNLNEDARYLKPNRGWLDLFKLSLSDDISENKFDFTTLTDNLSEDEVIIIDSHEDIFKDYQIHYWRKDRISDILPAIKCPSYKSETKIFKNSEIDYIGYFIKDQNHTESFVIENADKKLSISLVYGDTVKIKPRTFSIFYRLNIFAKLEERYKLWKIGDCACKQKKIRVWAWSIRVLGIIIEILERFPNIKDVKFGAYIDSDHYGSSPSKYDTIVFNNSVRQMSDNDTNFMFSGDSLTVVYDGNYYNFRLDQRINKSKDSYIRGKI